LAVQRFGLAGMIVSGIVTTLLFSGVFGIRRTKEFFGIHSREVLSWIWPSARLFLLLLALAFGVKYFTMQISLALVRFLVEACAIAVIASISLWFLGLPKSLRGEIRGRLQNWSQRWRRRPA